MIKVMYTPVNPSFYCIKARFKGVKIIDACFRDDKKKRYGTNNDTFTITDSRRTATQESPWNRRKNYCGP